MSSQATKFKEEQILIICPGSRTTMAQLGCSELTPPAYRIPTRMFRDEESGEWRPYRTYRRKKQAEAGAGGASGAASAEANSEDEWEYVEDPDSDEGAVYPMQGGYIVNMEAFLAFLEHVHGLLATTFHTTPIVLMTSPQWTRPDCETIALYIFEKTRTPALSMINSALATQYGLKWPHMTVVDVGFEKVDVTCIYDSRIVSHMEVGFAGEPGNRQAISGGEVFTRRLQALLQDKNFTYEMAEQLKKSPICEVLPYAPENPRLMELPQDDASVPVASVTVVAGTATATTAGVVATSDAPAGADGDEDAVVDDAAAPVAEDGVLDVATIVTSGQTKEFLAKKEKEKERTERGRFGRRSNKEKEAAEAAAAKPVRLPNAKRARVMFHFEEVVEEEEEAEPQAGAGASASASAHHDSNGSATAAAGTEKEADGSDDGSEGEGSDMEEDDEEEGEGEDEDAGSGEAKAEKPAVAAAAAAAEAAAEDKGAADKAKEESAKEAKVEDVPAAAESAPDAKKPEPAATPAEAKAPEAAPVAEKPKESEAAPAPAASASDNKPEPAATEDATMEDAPAAAEEEKPKADAPAEKPAEPAAPAESAEPATAATTGDEAAPSAAPAAAPADAGVVAVVSSEPQGRRYKRLRRDFEIGLERFTFADRQEIDRIVATIYRTVQSIQEFHMRPACWENLVFVGNGCRLRGLRDNILQTLNARHLISPSTATMFTSELPSNLGTPTGTGAQTPTGSFNTPPGAAAGAGASSSSVNPLLQAATMGSAAQNNSDGSANNTHHFHAQTPTSIKLAALPTYLGEWTKNGFEEAMFLGAQVAARLAFCVHNLDAAGQESQRQMSLTRVDYNELGPKGIRNHAMLG